MNSDACEENGGGSTDPFDLRSPELGRVGLDTDGV